MLITCYELKFPGGEKTGAKLYKAIDRLKPVIVESWMLHVGSQIILNYL